MTILKMKSNYIKKLKREITQQHNHALLRGELFFAIFFIFIIWLFFILSPGQKQQVKIGSSYMTMNNSFYPVINEQVENYVNNHHGKLYNRDPALNVNKQVEEINSFIHKGVSAIIINPVDGNSQKLENALHKAKQKGIKVVIVDSQTKSDRYIDCTVLSNNYRAGQLCAKNLLKAKSHANILLLEHYSALSANNRIQGFTDTIKQAKNAHNYHIVGKINTYGQSEITLPLVEKYLKTGRKFDTVMALNDQAAVGALAAIDEAKIKRHISVYGVDGSENMKKLLGVNPNATATAAQSPINLGKTAVKTAYKLIDGKKVPKKITLPVFLITNKNINKYNAVGWQ